MTYADFKQNPSFSDLFDAFNNQTIRTIVVKNWPNEDFLYTLFHRLNSNSVRLSPQELRKALLPGPFVTFVDRQSALSKPLQQALGIDQPDFRMRDVKVVIRHFAFKLYSSKYRGNLKEFLDETCRSLNSNWNSKAAENLFAEMENAIEVSIKIFGKKQAFRKFTDEGYESRLNRAVIDIFLFYFSDPVVAEEAMKHGKKVKKAFETLCITDRDFLSSLETSTKTTSVVYARFTKWAKVLKEVMHGSLPKFRGPAGE